MVDRNGIKIIHKAMEKLFRKYAQVAPVIILKILKSHLTPHASCLK
jgi:hypothetical protein